MDILIENYDKEPFPINREKIQSQKDSKTKYGRQNYKALIKYYREYIYNGDIKSYFLEQK